MANMRDKKLIGDGVLSACAPFFLFNRLLLFFPVLMRNHQSNNNSENHQNTESNVNHSYSTPFSKIVAEIININQKRPPSRDKNPNFSFETIGVRITIARIKLAALNNVFANSFRWILLNLIFKNILSKAEISVKQVKAKVIPPTCRGSSGIFRERLND